MLAHFFQLTPIPPNHMTGTYDPGLVMLSYFVAVFASYIALDITGHLRNPKLSASLKNAWILGGACAMGGGIWSMHFIGMLAFTLPMPMLYDSLLTLFSLIIAIFASSFALVLLRRRMITTPILLLGGLILGLAIVSMHYTGMEAMKVHVNIAYLPSYFMLSVLIAILASIAALWLALKSSENASNKHILLKIASALFMGTAICGMHYTGMAAAVFTPMTHPNHIADFHPELLAVAIAAIIILILSIPFSLSFYQLLSSKNAELSKTTTFLNNILECSVEYSIIAVDLDGMILLWNKGAKHLYGYEAKEVVGIKTIQMLAPHIYDTYFKEALKIGHAEGEIPRQRKDGRVFLENLVITLFKNVKKVPSGFLIITKDITQQKHLETIEIENKQMLEANRLKSEFLANMSHELRTPLNAVIGFSELLHKQKLGSLNEEQKDALNDIINSSKHLLNIINDILDLSRIEAGRLELRPQLIDLKVAVDEVLHQMRDSYLKKNIAVNVSVTPLKNIQLDLFRFRQILFNLLSNAFKFTSDAGNVSVQIVEHTAKSFMITVADSGIGMSEAEMQRLFTRFSQLDSSLSKMYQGTGLGLVVVKQIVEAQNGTISVASKKGVGTTFKVILPKTYVPTEVPEVIA